MSGDPPPIRRRTLLRATGSAFALAAIGSTTASAADSDDEGGRFSRRCPDATIRPSMDATIRPSMGDCAGASWGGCIDDHPETVALRSAVEETLAAAYPDAGALVDAGFKPYFDTISDDQDGWSHWLNPDHIGDDRVLDPDRPEAVLVDNDSWRSIGVMFIAVEGGEPVERPPAVYELEADDEYAKGDERDGDGHGDHDNHNGHGNHDNHNGHHDHGDGDEHVCSPWHYHAGVPGRFAWWYYRKVYEPDTGLELRPPCQTPCMMHVWTVDHPDGVYAHGGPPPEYRERPPAAEAGFETNAEPGEDELGWSVLPDEIVPEILPDDLR